ncbi:hypothetical protein Hdeb2414_s0004g00133821 [Helianthus debilis subsp. tardiflorus]
MEMKVLQTDAVGKFTSQAFKPLPHRSPPVCCHCHNPPPNLKFCHNPPPNLKFWTMDPKPPNLMQKII